MLIYEEHKDAVGTREMASISPEILYIQTGNGPVLHVKTEYPISVKRAVFLYMWRHARIAVLCLLVYSVMGVYCGFLITQGIARFKLWHLIKVY